jgi:hypothetical protein
MNFIDEFNKGQTGGNKGIWMGDGLKNLCNAINGLQKGRLYGIAAPPKAGKSTLVDYGTFFEPYLYCLEHGIPAEWIYYSLEIDRVSKEFDAAAFFLHRDFGITHITLPDGVLKDGLDEIGLDSDYLRGRLLDDEGKIIIISERVKNALIEVYETRIVPIFGEYSENGIQIKPGIVIFIETKDNPTGIYKYLQYHASLNGKFITTGKEKFSRITGFKPNNPEKYTFVITDHLRKMIPERGWQMKQTVDKMIEYQVEIRNWTGYTFIDIIHTNRDMVNQERLRFAKDMLYPTSDDIKDTGNLAEDADYVITMMNPNDDRYNLQKHFGVDIKDSSGNPLYPDLRTLHLVESRHCKYPQHFKVNMMGGYKKFEQIKTE